MATWRAVVASAAGQPEAEEGRFRVVRMIPADLRYTAQHEWIQERP